MEVTKEEASKPLDCDECWKLIHNYHTYVEWGNSISAAEEFISYLRSLGSIRHPDHIGLANDGEINFIWRRGDFVTGSVLDLGFCEYGEGSYYARLPDGTEFYDDVFQGDTLPQEVINILTLNEDDNDNSH